MSRALRAAVVLGAVVALSACQTGERPSFDTSPDGADTDAEPGVTRTEPFGERLERSELFDTTTPATETLEYEIFQPFQQIEATATLSRDPQRVVLRVRDTVYHRDGTSDHTCSVSSGTCRNGFDEQPISDLQITSGFWGPATQVAITSPRLDARIGPITKSTETIAGQAATCLTIPGPSYTDRYCALANGTVAEIDTASVQVTLTDYRPEFDESVWNLVQP